MTRVPSRSTTSVSGLPFEPEIVWEIVLPVIGAPLIETIRSPAWRPSAAAADPVLTLSTVVVGLPPEVMKSPVKSTNARMMFAAGPAKITSTRFQVRARQ